MKFSLIRILPALVSTLATTLALFATPAYTQDTMKHSDHNMRPGSTTLAPGNLPGDSIFHLDSLWVNHLGEARTLPELLSGKPTVSALIYTSCEHACPLIINDMIQIERELGEESAGVQFALFSMDPERDTPEKIKLWRNDRQLGDWNVYAPKHAGAELELAVALGIRIQPLANGDFAHSNVVTILNPDGTPRHRQVGLGVALQASADAVLEALTH